MRKLGELVDELRSGKAEHDDVRAGRHDLEHERRTDAHDTQHHDFTGLDDTEHHDFTGLDDTEHHIVLAARDDRKSRGSVELGNPAERRR
jgi:hypothetical protein